ncbi:exonuclease VII small subunit [Desulfosarcina cetonica]|uniref:exodeoxyribonuclease VII small subunit n=1 Tax=Desulfosarcina cetonica TaxID=90730 RepID=UPI0006D26BBB|nr:exodeoxyribonuclease VII small subunit [Desulfosarcina cetonica]VTR64966.1 exonuclease VII small subunit [Desulfosarcina cetonica]
MAAKAKPTFEKALSELEAIVKALEAGDLPLEKALEKFEAGIRLSRYCGEKLDEAERRVTLLMANEKDEVTEMPFDPES